MITFHKMYQMVFFLAGRLLLCWMSVVIICLSAQITPAAWVHAGVFYYFRGNKNVSARPGHWRRRGGESVDSPVCWAQSQSSGPQSSGSWWPSRQTVSLWSPHPSRSPTSDREPRRPRRPSPGHRPAGCWSSPGPRQTRPTPGTLQEETVRHWERENVDK